MESTDPEQKAGPEEEAKEANTPENQQDPSPIQENGSPDPETPNEDSSPQEDLEESKEEMRETIDPETRNHRRESDEASPKMEKAMRTTSMKSPRNTYSNDSKSKLSIFSSRFGSQSRFNQLSSAKSNLLPSSMELKKIQEELSNRTIELEELLESGHYREAEAVNLRIEKLKEEELVVQTSEFMKKNKIEAENLRKINEEQLQKFNEEWERIIEEHIRNVEKIEKDFVADQQTEIVEFNEKLKGFQIPPVKLSSKTLNLQKVLSQMLKQKK